ncbi:THO complex subunit 2 [Rhypophila decipiens]|uniref:THO complex subunit 2 n=1 Tax=Rhypophila decipiens TaxID=261697 RepID=A0AAN7BET8_9PEZI|nr:THO complex subunit 2 [Rhypophila decipiens]
MPPKRKRNDRGPSDGGSSRPSPYRPDSQMDRDRGYDNSRSGRGGGGRNLRRGPDRRDSPNSFGGAPPPPASPGLARPPSSSSTTNAPSAPASQVPAPTPAAAPVPSQPEVFEPMQSWYHYEIITEDRLSRWSEGARQEVIDHGAQSRDDEDLTEVATIFQEIIHSVIDGRLPGADAGKAVKDILGPAPENEDHSSLAFDPHTLFLDTVATLVEVEAAPYRPQLTEFMMATEVSPALMRQILEPQLLTSLGLVRESFYKYGIRVATNLLYRQSNYNLLREETEGYSKLVTELFATSSNEPPSYDYVQSAFNRVMSLIGTFDIGPGRVLDVTLDVFAAVLIKQFRFFVKFLRVSSWWPRNLAKQNNVFTGGLPVWAHLGHQSWNTEKDEEEEIARQRLERDIGFWDRAREIKLDAFFELGGRQLTPADEQRLINGLTGNERYSDFELEWIKITKTLPPSGNRDAAQMLGFKLRFYTSEARDPEDVLPANLLYLTALLIKIGFISLVDLWEHVWPLDEEMEKVRVARIKELEEEERKNRPGGASNALMMAGALPDDMPPPSGSRRDAGATKADPDSKMTEAAEEKPKLPTPDDQKVLLLRCLLTIGAIPEALFIIGRHDWILPAYPDLYPLIHRILHHSIETVHQQSRPVESSPSACPPKSLPHEDQSGVPKGSVKLADAPPKRALRWPHADNADTNEGTSYRFYWDEWSDNVPVCQTVDDLFTLCDTFLNLSGVHIGQDPALVAKICGIGIKSLAEDQSSENKMRWLELLKRLLVPSLSLGDPNSSVVDTVWRLLGQYPIHVRYNIYAEWYEGSISRLEPIKKAFARTRLETLSTMKRLSLTNIPQMAKTLAKTAYASPGVVCKVALLQIESYSNLIEAFVECAKYFTELGYDVLVWSVLSSLGGQQRSRTSASSVLLTSQWLQALSRFSGKVFQRYSNMDPTPILRYVNDQLLKGNSTDLVILKELISSMGGVVSDVDFTDAQIRAMTGGEILRRETLISLGDKRSVSVRSADRFMKALMHNKLAGSLLINIAQYRQSAIYKVQDTEAHIKYLATMVDDTHLIFLQYLDLLRSNMDNEKFDSVVPGVVDLMREFGLEASLAFMIGRASLRSDKVKAAAVADADGDVSMETAGDETKPDAAESDDSPSRTVRRADPLGEALQPVVDEISSALPDQVLRYLSPTCFVFFWSLQLGDFSFPQDSYQAENARLKKMADEVMRDRSDMTRPGMNRKNQKRNEILARQDAVIKENSREIERFHKARLQISKQLNVWFPAAMSKVDFTADALLEHCIVPRLRLSAVDSEYCFRLIKFLHEFAAPNFKLMSFYDQLFNHNRLRAIIFNCTVREAEHVGRFLRNVLGDLSRWHGDKNAYEKEALGSKDLQGKKTRHYLGFATAFDADDKPTAFIEHDPFRDLLFRWHKELNTALRSCLHGLEWMHIRNAITILKSVIDFFPAINFMADKFLEQLKTITDREAASKTASESEHAHRVDLSVTAQTAYSELQKRKNKWILVQAFRPGLTGDAKEEKSASVPANSSLRASAQEFKPTTGKKQTTTEVEDGEVKDGKTSKPSKETPNGREPREPARPSLPVRDTASRSSAATTAAPARTTTPQPIPSAPASAPGGRSETNNRFTTLPPGGHGLPNRPELPRRPDVPIPSSISADRYGSTRHDRPPQPPRDGRDYRDAREPRDHREPHPHPAHARDVREPYPPRDGRDHRAPEPLRPERPREFPGPDRRPEPDLRESGRLSRGDMGRPAELPPRWNEPAPPPERESRQTRERAPSGQSRESRDNREHAAPAPPPPPPAAKEAPVPALNPDRARLLAEPKPTINPARAALIDNNIREPPSREHSSRSTPRDQGRERPPRTESPRPPVTDDHATPSGPQADKAREERHGRHRHSDYHASSRDGRADSAPSQPRQDRNAERENGRAAALRDAISGPPAGRGAEADLGRPSQQDPNYGRLNAIQSVVDIPTGPAPLGPRGRGRNTARVSSVNSLPPRQDGGRFQGPEPTRAPSPDRAPPTGPSAQRPPRRGQFDNNSVNSTLPNVPPPAQSTGVHPERLRQINNHQAPPTGPSASSAPPSAPTAPGIHPDRLNQIAAVPQPSSPAPHSRPPMNTPDRPSMSAPNTGPRQGPHGTPNTEFSTPTGPASSNERMRPGGNRQLRAIQNTLDKVTSGDRSGGRMSRARPNLAGSDAQILAGQSPVGTPVHERSDPMRDSSRREMSSDRAQRGTEPIQVVGDSRDPRGNANGDEYSTSRDHERSSRRDHHRSDRSNRPSRRSSRERSPGPSRENKEPRDYRERRSDAVATAVSGSNREPERDSGSSRRSTSMRDLTSSRDAMPPRGEMAPPRESSHRQHRNDGPPSGPPMGGRVPIDEYPGRSASSRGSGGPRESRSSNDLRGDDGRRKRRSEGPPTDSAGGHQDKRPRR